MHVELSSEVTDAGEFARLLRFMTRPGPRFGLALATYADELVADRLRARAREQASSAHVRTTSLGVKAGDRIAERLVAESEGFDVVFVTGLDEIAYDVHERGPIARAVAELNFQRDTLPERLDVRVVFWVSFEAYGQLARLAWDLLEVMLVRFEFSGVHERATRPEPPPVFRPKWLEVPEGVALVTLEHQAESFARRARTSKDEFSKADAAAMAGRLFASVGRLEDGAQWLAKAAASYERLAARDKDPQWTLAAAAELGRQAELARVRGNIEEAQRLGTRALRLAERVPTEGGVREQARALETLATLQPTTTNLTDDDLLDRWRAGDREAGGRLLARYFGPLVMYFRNRMPDDDVEDLLQQTFARLISMKDRPVHSVKWTLFHIARNIVSEHLPHNLNTRITNNDIGTIASPENMDDSLVVAQQYRLLFEALRRIPMADQDLLELYYWHDFTTSELGALLDIPEATVRQRLATARKQLRRAFTERLGTGARTPDDADLERSLAKLRNMRLWEHG